MKERLIVIDNYDSFTYNLVQYLNELTGQKVEVARNDSFSLEALSAYDTFILSPGPGLPSEAGLLKQVIARFGPGKKMLGVCLGHQAIAEVYGGKLVNLDRVYHGVASGIYRSTDKHFLFDGIPDPFEAGRYHSWIVEKESLPACLEILAEDGEGRIMALRHREYDLYGLQFHPESILTPDGKTLLKNFLEYDIRKVNRK